MDQIRLGLNPALGPPRILAGRVNRTVHSREVLEELRRTYGDLVLDGDHPRQRPSGRGRRAAPADHAERARQPGRQRLPGGRGRDPGRARFRRSRRSGRRSPAAGAAGCCGPRSRADRRWTRGAPRTRARARRRRHRRDRRAAGRDRRQRPRARAARSAGGVAGDAVGDRGRRSRPRTAPAADGRPAGRRDHRVPRSAGRPVPDGFGRLDGLAPGPPPDGRPPDPARGHRSAGSAEAPPAGHDRRRAATSRPARRSRPSRRRPGGRASRCASPSVHPPPGRRAGSPGAARRPPAGDAARGRARRAGRQIGRGERCRGPARSGDRRPPPRAHPGRRHRGRRAGPAGSRRSCPDASRAGAAALAERLEAGCDAWLAAELPPLRLELAVAEQPGGLPPAPAAAPPGRRPRPAALDPVGHVTRRSQLTRGASPHRSAWPSPMGAVGSGADWTETDRTFVLDFGRRFGHDFDHHRDGPASAGHRDIIGSVSIQGGTDHADRGPSSVGPGRRGGRWIRPLGWAAAASLLALSLAGPAAVGAASPPIPTYGSATVDGLTGDWNLSADKFADMTDAGNPAKPVGRPAVPPLRLLDRDAVRARPRRRRHPVPADPAGERLHPDRRFGQGGQRAQRQRRHAAGLLVGEPRRDAGRRLRGVAPPGAGQPHDPGPRPAARQQRRRLPERRHEPTRRSRSSRSARSPRRPRRPPPTPTPTGEVEATATPTSKPTGGVHGATATPKVTLPPTATIGSSEPPTASLSMVFLGLGLVIAGALVLLDRPRLASGRRRR